MIPDVRIKYNGVNVRLVGFGFRKFHNLRILDAGIKAMKARLAKGVSEDDGPTKPLKKRYARFKSKKTGRRAVRDMNLTGALLDEIKPRYSDDRQAIADAGTRLGRMKARVHSDLLRFSNGDQAKMLELATQLFADGVEQTIRTGRNLPRAATTSRSTITARRTYFGRAA
jgi:hypothetical protein